MDKLITILSKKNKTSLISLSILLLLFIGFVDWVTGIELSVSIFYLIPIAISAWFISKNAGILFSILSTSIWFFSDILNSHLYRHPLIPSWNTLVMLGFFIVITLLLAKLKYTIDSENNLALNIQKSLLPQNNPQAPGYRIFSIWEPTKVVGGDYYDFINLSDNKIGISLADVCGHGFPAALLMSNIQATFRIVAEHNHSPQEVCNYLNLIMFNYRMPEKFTSFFYGILDPENKLFTYSNAGHPPPIILRDNGEIEHLSLGGFLLGVEPNTIYEQSTVKLNKGDKILFFTDGIIETRNKRSKEFGESRLIEFCYKNMQLQEEDFKKEILATLNMYSNNNIDDDITLIIISVDQ